MPKGFVKTTEMRSLCDKIRELLLDRSNVWNEQQWDELQRYTKLQRCFTLCEADSICWMHYNLQRKKDRKRK